MSVNFSDSVNRSQVLQLLVLWSIVGPYILLIVSVLTGWFILAVEGPNSIPWISKLGFLLVYYSFFGALLVLHVCALFGIVGLLVLPWLSVKRKLLTLSVSAISVCLSAIALPLFYSELGF